MSRTKSNRSRRFVGLSVATVAGGALAAAWLSIGTAHACAPDVHTHDEIPGVVTAGASVVLNNAHSTLT